MTSNFLPERGEGREKKYLVSPPFVLMLGCVTECKQQDVALLWDILRRTDHSHSLRPSVRSAMTVPRDEGKQRPPQYWSTSGVACCAVVVASTFYGFILFSRALQCVLLCLQEGRSLSVHKCLVMEVFFSVKFDRNMV